MLIQVELFIARNMSINLKKKNVNIFVVIFYACMKDEKLIRKNNEKVIQPLFKDNLTIRPSILTTAAGAFTTGDGNYVWMKSHFHQHVNTSIIMIV